MAIVSAKCPNCGGEIQLDDAKEVGFCMFCGAKVMVEDATQKVEVSGSIKLDNSDKLKNCLNLANRAFLSVNYVEAYNYYTKVLEMNSEDYHAIYRKALCAGYLSNLQNPRTNELINGFKKAFNIIGNDVEKKVKMREELVVLALSVFPTQNIAKKGHSFKNSSSCSCYVESLFNAICILYKINELITTETEELKKKVLIHLIELCDGFIDGERFNYSNGFYYNKDGGRSARISSYYISNDAKKEIISKKEKAIDCYNNLSSNQNGITKIQSEIDDYTKKIKNHKLNIKKHWKEYPKERIKFLLIYWVLLVLGLIACVLYIFAPIGIILLIVRIVLLKKIEKTSFPAELIAEKKQNKENCKELKKKIKELKKYKKSTLIEK
ncbi:hypothetical protein JYG23_10340 [Sedimentibacter sp. zth1]|uniref:hypothetical protein n=1 Tax=Sedimentibacter sp. zth1 TaxID=2816908 RepID=UPI001A919453|nr:hypothetical protein [Sedimentibacter sp. zth1]QSX05085.1 hypothetical protein JYG23_10340 [Sedimentibacter sp. zth1]